MKPAVPEPSPPPEGPVLNGAVTLPPARSDAPVTPVARKNGVMSQQDAQAPVQHAQPPVGSLAAHRPRTVAAAASSDLAPDIDADLDTYEEAQVEGAPLP